MKKVIITLTLALFFSLPGSYAGLVENCPGGPVLDDTTPPTITCPGNLVSAADPGLCSGSVATPGPEYTDDVGVTTLTWVLTGATTGNSPPDGINLLGTHTFNVGVTTVIYTASDAAGNSASCSYTVTINDIQPPIIMCPPDVTVNTGQDSCMAYVAPGSPMASDNCSLDLIWNDYTGTSSAEDVYPMGVTTVTWHATDNSGNVTTCSQIVTVIDADPPEITCPPDTILACATDYYFPDPTTVLVADNCDPDPEAIFISEAIDSIGPENGWCPRLIHRYYRATDDFGNSASCSQTIAITEEESCHCYLCQDTVPHFYVDLEGSCDESFTITDAVRMGYCCHASWPDRCISFSVSISEASSGIFIEILEGAVPPGWWWQIDCSDSVEWNDTIYLPPDTYHTITMCEAGNNENTYLISAICILDVPEVDLRGLDLKISPNPVNASPVVSYWLQKPAEVSLSVIDLLGNERQTLHFGKADMGDHQVTLDVGQLPTGIYYLRLQAGDQSSTGKMMVVR